MRIDIWPVLCSELNTVFGKSSSNKRAKNCHPSGAIADVHSWARLRGYFDELLLVVCVFFSVPH